jgi:hypothetical protein
MWAGPHYDEGTKFVLASFPVISIVLRLLHAQTISAITLESLSECMRHRQLEKTIKKFCSYLICSLASIGLGYRLDLRLEYWRFLSNSCLHTRYRHT